MSSPPAILEFCVSFSTIKIWIFFSWQEAECYIKYICYLRGKKKAFCGLGIVLEQNIHTGTHRL